MTPSDETIKLDEAEPLLAAREFAADALMQLAATSDAAGRVRIAHELARAARLEIEILETREAVAAREVLAAIETALAGAQ